MVNLQALFIKANKFKQEYLFTFWEKLMFPKFFAAIK